MQGEPATTFTRDGNAGNHGAAANERGERKGARVDRKGKVAVDENESPVSAAGAGVNRPGIPGGFIA